MYACVCVCMCVCAFIYIRKSIVDRYFHYFHMYCDVVLISFIDLRFTIVSNDHTNTYIHTHIH